MIFNGNRLIKNQTAPFFLTDKGFRLNGQRVFSYWTALIFREGLERSCDALYLQYDSVLCMVASLVTGVCYNP